MDDVSFNGFVELLRLLDKGKADKKWYVDMISTLSNGNHQIFQPNYIYFKEAKTKEVLISNAGFFDYLPDSKHKGNGSVLLTSE